MKNKINLDVIIDDDKWIENVDFDAQKVAFELKDLVFDFVKKECDHELLALGKDLSVNVCLSNDEQVHKLNKEFRDMDKPTNVLSFANIDDDEFWDELEEDIEHNLGDIILSFECVFEQ
jgi:probable rRNA maturation factor